jgi:hypothetical protein
MSTVTNPTPPQIGFSVLEQDLADLANQATEKFEALLTGIKNNHGVSTAGVENLLHQGEELVKTVKEAIQARLNAAIESRNVVEMPTQGAPTPAVPENPPAPEDPQQPTDQEPADPEAVTTS